MNNKYIDIFETLTKSYYDDDFDSTLIRLMGTHESSPQETFEVITSLCGVNIDYDNNYIENLKKAISNYVINQNVVKKLSSCNSSCVKDKDGKSKCMLACPFNAIIFNEEHKTVIDSDKCIHCGLCIDACKDGNIIDQIDFIPIINSIKNNDMVIATVDPSINGQFGPNVSMNQLREALIKIGFTDMVETAFGADMLTIKEACEFDDNVHSQNDLMISSYSCPMWAGMLNNVDKEVSSKISKSVSPMIATARVIKSLNKKAIVVFIGPCIAKKAEAKEKDVADTIDFVLTFKELDEIFRILKINPSELKGIETIEYTSKGGRLHAKTGGLSMAVNDVLKDLYSEKHKLFKSKQGNGVKECEQILKQIYDGTINATFIEGMGCIGGCIAGPKTLVPPETCKIAVDDYASNASIKIASNNNILHDISSKIGIEYINDYKNINKTKMLHKDI